MPRLADTSRHGFHAIEPLESRVLLAALPAGFLESRLTGTLGSATAMAFAPDGRLFVAQQDGQLFIAQNNNTSIPATEAIDLVVDNVGERGLLGIAFDPDWETSQEKYVWLYYTVPGPTLGGAGAHNRVSRFTVTADTIDAGSEQVILDLNDLSNATNHNGGAMHFGTDGKLYIAVGENANGSNSQTLGNLLGKMLRINKDGTIPDDNPFLADATGINQAIWALGLRNPFTFDVQRGTGRIFINDVGQSTWEEINDGTAGSNYGWPGIEGKRVGQALPSIGAYQDPLYTYSNDATTCAITGGAFYNPASPLFPSQYTGDYFYADYCGGWIRALDLSGAAPTVVNFATGASSPVDLKVGPDGSLFYLQRGAAYRIYPNPANLPVIETQPGSQSVEEGTPVTFTVAATGPGTLSYQWQRDGVDIAGADSPTYELSSPSLADSGATFRGVVTNASGSKVSDVATLTVKPDATPPQVVSSSFAVSPGQSVIVRFSEDVLDSAQLEDITLQSQDNGQLYYPVDLLTRHVGAETEVEWVFSLPGMPLPNGLYVARVPADAIADPAGHELTQEMTLPVRVLAGDVDGDGKITVDDYFAIDFGFANASDGYPNGDFNYSGGAPDGDDYFTIDQSFIDPGAPLFALGPAPLPAPATHPFATPLEAKEDDFDFGVPGDVL
jgi:glucose/arabinose dehydrogenase